MGNFDAMPTLAHDKMLWDNPCLDAWIWHITNKYCASNSLPPNASVNNYPLLTMSITYLLTFYVIYIFHSGHRVVCNKFLCSNNIELRRIVLNTHTLLIIHFVEWKGLNELNDHVILFLILIQMFVRQILTCGLYYMNMKEENLKSLL